MSPFIIPIVAVALLLLNGAPEPDRAILLPDGVSPASLETNGMENASVLPEPVRPRPSTSRPSSVSGSVAV